MRRSGFVETLAVLVAVDVVIAAFRWWRGLPEIAIFLGFAAGFVGSFVLAVFLAAGDELD